MQPLQRQVEMALGEAPGELVGAGRVEEIAGERAQLGAVALALIVHRERLVAGARVHAPADVRGGVGLAVAPGGEVAAHQLGIGPLPLDRHHVVALDPERDAAVKVALEGEVDIALIHHEHRR